MLFPVIQDQRTPGRGGPNVQAATVARAPDFTIQLLVVTPQNLVAHSTSAAFAAAQGCQCQRCAPPSALLSLGPQTQPEHLHLPLAHRAAAARGAVLVLPWYAG